MSNNDTYPAVGDGAISRVCQLGPMARHAGDLMPLLRAIAEAPTALRPTVDVDVSSLKVYDVKTTMGESFLFASR